MFESHVLHPDTISTVYTHNQNTPWSHVPCEGFKPKTPAKHAKTSAPISKTISIMTRKVRISIDIAPRYQTKPPMRHSKDTEEPYRDPLALLVPPGMAGLSTRLPTYPLRLDATPWTEFPGPVFVSHPVQWFFVFFTKIPNWLYTQNDLIREIPIRQPSLKDGNTTLYCT